jgi:hypothetical protein
MVAKVYPHKSHRQKSRRTTIQPATLRLLSGVYARDSDAATRPTSANTALREAASADEPA